MKHAFSDRCRGDTAQRIPHVVGGDGQYGGGREN